ncbi:TonB-dependent receptor plug domain-containing protein, partial [Litorivivens sp.]|uniref:TonB-dependent receptor plug domain-containing protein n=1 Tax=Litorivivens sp. TaxID=2020868 RepID=UPI00356B1535
MPNYHKPKALTALGSACLLGTFGLFPSIAFAEHDLRKLAELSLEQLLEVNVSLSARKGETLKESPAAVYVLTNETIRRSGATTIPELLRLVPGVEVTRFGTGKWGIGIRGFNGGLFTNRMLILIDGRSVFSPAKVGMFWDTVDTLIPDIDRIEVVRGPGTAFWGGNAFNGVINIVTSHSRDTTGTLAEASAGNEEKWSTNLRYGTELADNQYGRVYLKSFERDDAIRPDGSKNFDHWTGSQAGIRWDAGTQQNGT